MSNPGEVSLHNFVRQDHCHSARGYFIFLKIFVFNSTFYTSTLGDTTVPEQTMADTTAVSGVKRLVHMSQQTKKIAI